MLAICFYLCQNIFMQTKTLERVLICNSLKCASRPYHEAKYNLDGYSVDKFFMSKIFWGTD